MLPRRRLQHGGKLLAFITVAVALFLGGLEGLCRLVEARFPELKAPFGALTLDDEGSQRFSAPMPGDPRLAWRLDPGYHGVSTGVLVKHNRLGLRSPELDCGPHPSVVRVLLLGDSTIYGHGVPEEKTVRSRLEVALRRALPNREVQVVNGGIPGFSSRQSLELLKQLEICVAPDIVVVASLFCDAERVPVSEPAWPRITAVPRVDPDGTETHPKSEGRGTAGKPSANARVTPSWVTSLTRALTAHSALLRAGYLAAAVADDPELWNRLWIRSPGGKGTGGGATSSRPGRLIPRVRLEAYRQNLKHIIERTRARGGDVVLLVLESRAGFQTSCAAALRGERSTGASPGPGDGLSTQGWADPVEAYRHAMHVVGTSEHVPVVDMRPALTWACRQGARDPKIWYLDEVHPTAYGHQLMTDRLVPAILSLVDSATRRRQATPAPAP